MKLEILNIDKLISLNKSHATVNEITSPRLFSNKMMYDPDGVLSTELFGISKGDRRGTFGYIDLRQPFLHPHIYSTVLKRMFKGIIFIVSGQKKYSINEEGLLIQDDENGWTGLNQLYKHWDEIKWENSTSSVDRSKLILSGLTKEQAFITKLLVIPPAYRDVLLAGTADSSDHVHELNKHYTSLIRAVSTLNEGGLFARTSALTQAKVQDILVDIFSFLKGQIKGKKGLIRRHLLGKSVEFGTRSVISAPSYNNETIGDNMIDIEHTALPISQCCSTFYPFIETWLKNFFTREIINDPTLVTFYDPVKEKEVLARMIEPEVQFSERAIRRMINDYIFNPDNRFKVLKVKATLGGNVEMSRPINVVMLLKGKKILPNNIQENLNRAMTITDILYLACVDVCEKRHVMVTRYPVGTDKGLFFNKIRVQSTTKHIRVTLNGREYPFYPDIDPTIDYDHIGVQFIDTAVFSNSNLDGMGGDYDGDQVSIRGIWADESNFEADMIMNRKMTALNITGSNSRVVSKEILNSYYELTKLGENPKNVGPIDLNHYLGLSPDGFTRSLIAKTLADTADIDVEKNVNRRKARYNTWDKMTIPANYFYERQPETETTIGRFLFNHYVLNGSGIIAITKMRLDILNKGGLGDLDNLIGDLYMNDEITRPQFNAYIDRRDNLGYWLNGMLAHTISARMLKPLKEIDKLKLELFKKYEKELSEGNIDTMKMVSDQLIAKAKEILKDDPGMDLYLSGDLDFNNNYRSNAIVKGAVKNMINNEFDFIGTSFMNGIDIKDIPAHANSILSAQYPTSIATADSGYMGKKLLALLQMMQVDEPGSDCGTKALIPVTITKKNRRDLIYSYIDNGGQLLLLTRDNIDRFMGKRVMMRSPMGCISVKICNHCAGELFYKLGITQAGLFATQLSHSALNLALKSKHDQSIDLYQLDPKTIIKDI